MKFYTFEDIKKTLLNEEIKFEGKLDEIIFNNVGTLKEHNKHSLIWIKNPNENEFISASVVICPFGYSIKKKDDTLYIYTNNPKYIFSKLVSNLFKEQILANIHTNALIDSRATIGKNCYIGAFTSIGNCVIEDNVVIYNNCTIYDQVKISKGSIINSGTVIGADGFGYSKNETGKIEKFPHIGGVFIGENVEIGSNTSIDRGSIGNTIINNNVKIDNLVHIAHNVVIGENTFIIANSMIGGSTTIGNNSWIAPSVSILQQLKIGNNVTIGVGSVVTKNIPDNETWLGNPAQEINEFKKDRNRLKNLTNNV